MKLVTVHTLKFMLPYSRFLSREKSFTNCVKILFVEKTFADYGNQVPTNVACAGQRDLEKRRSRLYNRSDES